MIPAPIRYAIKVLTLVPILLCRQLSKLLPRKNNCVCIGAWFGDLYADNSKYFTEYLLDNSNFDITWIGNEPVRRSLPEHQRLHFARRGSWHAVLALARARFWISCIFYYHDLTSLPIDGGAICINLWHGIPVKKTGRQTSASVNSRMKFSRRLLIAFEELYSRIVSGEKEWLLVASEGMAKIQLAGYPCNFDARKILRIGTPRNDFLINNSHNEVLRKCLKEKYAQLLDFNPEKKVVLYLPTWREFGKNVFCFYTLDKTVQSEIKSILDNNSAVLIEKHHFHTYETYPCVERSICSIAVNRDILPKIDAQEFLLCADMLICDYSGAYVDFGLLQRPCITFAYDLDDYSSNDYGLAYDIREVAAGPVITSVADLPMAIGKALAENSFNPAHGYRTLVEYEKGNSCTQLLEFMKTKIV